jgi:hypothetical protein
MRNFENYITVAENSIYDKTRCFGSTFMKPLTGPIVGELNVTLILPLVLDSINNFFGLTVISEV